MSRLSLLICAAVVLCVAGFALATEEQAPKGPQQVFVPQGRTVVKAINAGGDEVKGVDGTEFEADTDYSSKEASEARVNEGSLTDGFDNDVYVSERVGKHFAYTFDLPKKGSYYTLVLKFAETAPDAAAGANVFDIALNGRPLYQSVDIFSVIGAGIPMDLPLQFFYTANGKLRFSEKLIIPVTENQLVLELVARNGNAKISGLTLFRGLLQQNEQKEEAAQTTPTGKKVKEQSFLVENGPLLGVLALVGVVVVAVTYYAKNAPKKLSKSDKARKIGQTVKKATSPKNN